MQAREQRDVVWLEITVLDTRAMCVRERVGDLGADTRDPRP
jgi:hypothetical protein